MKKVKCVYEHSGFVNFGEIYILKEEFYKDDDLYYRVIDNEGDEFGPFYAWKFEVVNDYKVELL